MDRYLESPLERLLFENHPLPLWIYDRNTLAFLAVNNAALDKYGYSREEFLRMTVADIRPVEEMPRLLEVIAGYGTNLRHAGIWHHRLKDGSIIPVEVFTHTLNLQGQEAVLVLARDVTEHQRVEEEARLSQNRLTGLVNAAMDAVISIDNEHKIVLFNPAAKKMFGYEIEEILGQPLDMLLPEGQRAAHTSFIQAFGRTAVTSRTMNRLGEVSGRRKNGEEFPIEASISQVDIGGEKLFTAILRDVSERKLAENALQRQLRDVIALNSVTTFGAKATDIDTLFQNVTHVIAEMIYPDNCGIILPDEDLRTWTPHQSYQGANPENLNKKYSVTQGVVGKVITSGKIVRLGDIRQEPAYLEVTPGIQSELCVPIIVNGKVFGCVNAESREADAFTEHDERFLSTVADSLATAIEKIQLLENEKRRRKDAEILYTTTRDLVIARDLSNVLHLIVERAAAMVGASSGGLYLCDSEQRQVRSVVSYNTLRDYSGTVLKYGEGAAGIVAETGQPLIIRDYRTWEGRAAVFEEEQPFTSLLSVPMYWQDRVIGVIHIHEKTATRSFTDDDLQIIRHFANQAAIAVENARLFETEQRRRQEAETLREATLALTYSMGPEKLYEVILDSLHKLIPYDSASIELLDQGDAQIVAGRSLPEPEHIIGTTYQIPEGKWGVLENFRDPIIISDVRADDRFVKLEGTEYIRGWMGVPLYARDRLIGFLNLDSRTIGFYTAAHAALAQTFGSQAAIAIDNARLLNELQTSNAELILAYHTTLEGWAKALELRDKETEGHSRRVMDMTLYLARQFGISGPALTHIRRGVLLHDIGKMGVPDQILKKKGALTAKEWEEMRKHPQYAYDLLYPISFLRAALDIPYCHHERWDGSGYPRRLKGHEIPLAARIFTVVDVWDALSHDRPYRSAWSKEEIVVFLTEQSGILFDPAVVFEFLKMIGMKGE